MNIQILGPEKRNAVIIDFFRARGDDIRVQEDVPDADALKAWGADYLISNGFAPIVKEPLLSAFPGRIINIHSAYVPFGRGIFPNFWCFLHGAPVGVTVHLIDAGIDTGPILARGEISLSDDETLRSSYGILCDASECLFMEVWDDFITGNLAYEVPGADEPHGFYHSRIASEQLIDLLPDKWDTPIWRIREMGREMVASKNFWDACERDVQAVGQ